MDLIQLFSMNQMIINIQLYFELHFLYFLNKNLTSTSNPIDSDKGIFAFMQNKFENSFNSS